MRAPGDVQVLFALESHIDMIANELGIDPIDFRMRNALVEWPNGGMKFPKADIRSPFEFEQIAKLVRPEDFDQ